MIKGPDTLAVGRLVLDPYSATLFSSSPKTFAAIERMMQGGLTMEEAIERIAYPDSPDKWTGGSAAPRALAAE
jgi:conjugal transfer ATP-binding protein TraC